MTGTLTTWLEGRVQTVAADDPRLEKVFTAFLLYDPHTGVFRWAVNRRGKSLAGCIAGSLHSTGYVHISLCGRLYKAHRLAWLFVYGTWPTCHIDHINGDKQDNRIANLREATRSENRQNLRLPYKNNKSGLMGVSAEKSRWRAVIHKDGRQNRLGSFATPQEAHAAYLEAKSVLHPFAPIVGAAA